MYQFLIRVLSPLLWLLIIVEAMKRQGGTAFFLQRLGLAFPSLPKPSQKPRIWLHCASVGEVKAAQPLIQGLHSEYEWVITTNTPTGKTLVESLFTHSVIHFYLPLDWPFAIKHFLKKVQPQKLWVIETEIWPNLYTICAQKNIEISILNGRLSQKTLRSPHWLKKAYQQSLSQVSHLFARSEADAERFISLGANPARVEVFGNLKYGQLESLPHYVRPIPRPYVLLASSHADEELQIAQIWLALQRPELLVIVPRHPKRSRKIQLQFQALPAAFKVASLGEQADATTQFFIDDRLGQLLPLFEHALLVIMGGSFVPKGGHNILEPAAYGKAIITGADMADFESEMALLLGHDAIIQCQNYPELKATLSHLLQDANARQKLGHHAKQTLQNQPSILQKYLTALRFVATPRP